MKLQYIIRKHSSHIELKKDKRCSLGISVTESHKEKGRPVIKNIKNGSLAQKSHCVAVGDVISSIGTLDAQGMRKAEVKRLLKESDILDMRVEYFTREACFGFCRIYCCQRMFLSLRKEGGSFGFVLRSNDSKRAGATEYPVISNIKRGGPADREGNLMSGDRLLEVDNQSLSWLPLVEVAELLQEKNEAVFLVEYNVGLVDLVPDIPINLDIDCPDTNLGISVTANDCSKMCISAVQQGSLAQRCGAFSVGDEILAINGVDAKTLTIPKTMEILNSFRKYPGKLTFIHTSGSSSKQENKVYNSISDKESLSTVQSKVLHVPPNSPANSCHDSLKEYMSFKFDQKTADYNNYQLKTMSILSEINFSLARFYSSLFEKNSNSFSPNRDVNLDGISSRTIRLKGEYQSLRNLTSQLTFHILRNTIQVGDQVGNDNQIGDGKDDVLSSETNMLENFSENGDFDYEFVDNLNEMTSYEFVGKNEMQRIVGFVSNCNENCSNCRIALQIVTFTVQRVLLLLSLGSPNPAEERFIAQAIVSASRLCDLCERCKEKCDSNHTKTKPKQFVQTNRDYSKIPRTWGVGASSTTSETTTKSIENDSSADKLNFQPHIGLDISRQTAIYKLTDVRNEDTDESCSSYLKDTGNTKGTGDSIENLDTFVDTNKFKHTTDTGSRGNEERTNTETGLQTCQNCGILSKSEKELCTRMPSVRPKVFPSRYEMSHPHISTEGLTKKDHSIKYGIKDEEYQASHLQQNLGCDQNLPKDRVDPMIHKTHSETLEVSLKADRGRFGVLLGYNNLSLDEKNRIPIIIAIKPRSAAKRIGVLKKGDRILAMNGFSTVGLSVKELERMKRELFTFSEIVFKVEFDVTDAEVTWGTFDVHLEDNVKLGLVMNEPANPSLVKGVVRGSAAHRSGQVFPEDEVLSLTSLKEDTLDLRSWCLKKHKTYRLTIRREQGRERMRQNVRVSPHLAFDPKSLVQRGSHFNIKRTSVRAEEAVEGRDKILLEHEFTLFRDPLDWDFGFLFGENPRTGRAYITEVRPGGPADDSKVIKRNDRIVEVNGVCVDGRTENSTMNLLMQADDRVNLVTRRVLNYK